MKIIDLTMPLDANTPVYPGDPKPKITIAATIERDGCNGKHLEFNSHFGTHIDAPFHMLADGKKLDEFPLEKFIGEAIVIDARKKNSENEIIVDLSQVKRGDIVFFWTGNTDKAYTAEFFENIPVISLQTAKELCARGAKIIGIDSYTPDNEPFLTHKELLAHEILILENLVNLEKVAGKRFECIIMPLKIVDADGAPCRVVARLP
ncbi:MAG TPA: cyclase family protein [archaeon]|nr:cyclase family protein [archaeon]